MAATNVPVEQSSLDGILDLQASETPFGAGVTTAGGIKFANDGRTLLLLRNAGAGPHPVTVVSQKTVLGLAVDDLVSPNIVAGKWALLGPFPVDTFNVPSGADAGKAVVYTDGTQTEVKAHVLRQ